MLPHRLSKCNCAQIAASSCPVIKGLPVHQCPYDIWKDLGSWLLLLTYLSLHLHNNAASLEILMRKIIGEGNGGGKLV